MMDALQILRPSFTGSQRTVDIIYLLNLICHVVSVLLNPKIDLASAHSVLHLNALCCLAVEICRPFVYDFQAHLLFHCLCSVMQHVICTIIWQLNIYTIYINLYIYILDLPLFLYVGVCHIGTSHMITSAMLVSLSFLLIVASCCSIISVISDVH